MTSNPVHIRNLRWNTNPHIYLHLTSLIMVFTSFSSFKISFGLPSFDGVGNRVVKDAFPILYSIAPDKGATVVDYLRFINNRRRLMMFDYYLTF